MIFGINTTRENFFKFHSPNVSWNYVQQFRNITSGVYAKYRYKSCYTNIQIPGFQIKISRSPESGWLIFFRSRFTFRFHLAVFITEMFRFPSETNPLIFRKQKENWQESLFFKHVFVTVENFLYQAAWFCDWATHFFVWKSLFGILDLTKILCRIRGTNKIFLTGYGNWPLAGKRDSPKFWLGMRYWQTKPVFWIEMTEVQDVESVVKKEGEMQD